MLANSLILIFGILIAILGALLLVPVIWHKAQTLARREAEATLPMTQAEIRGEVDKVRAQAAMKIRSLEIIADKARNKEAAARAELGVLTARLAALTSGPDSSAAFTSAVADITDTIDDADEKSGELRILLATAMMRIEQLEADLRSRQRNAAPVEAQSLRQQIMQLNSHPGEDADAAIRSYLADIAASVTKLTAAAAPRDSRLTAMLETARSTPQARTGALIGQMLDDRPPQAIQPSLAVKT